MSTLKANDNKVDLEHHHRPASFDNSTLDDGDFNRDEWLRTQGEKNPFYVHDLTWTPAEEKEIVRTFDFRVLSWIALMFLFMQLDRGNMGNALTDNFMEDLNISLNTVNLGSTIFTLTFCLFEIPSNIIIVRAGPQRWIPFLMVLWGLATASQFFLKDRVTFLICRALVGMFEAGYIPGIALYLTSYYKRSEMAVRLSIFWSTLAVANSIAGVLAYGILHMRGVAGKAGWRWLFLFEGLATVIIGLLSFLMLPGGPTATKGFFRHNGYLTPRQEQIAMTRLIRDDPTKADTRRKSVSKKHFFKALLSPKIWPNILIGFFGLLPFSPLTILSPLIIKNLNLGVPALVSNLLVIPGYVISLSVMTFVSWSSDRHNERAFHGALASTYYAICILALATLPADANKFMLYFALIFAMGGQTCWHPVNAAWIAGNTAPVGKRSIALAMYIISVNACDMVSVNLFRDEDAPRFIRGFWILFGALLLTIVLFIFQRYHLMYINRKRDEKTKDWTSEDWRHYNETTKDEGDDHLSFRYNY
ncbi:major facilitator superfamily domain-containing protein [Linnemannia elongata]|nr:major facilitator superfamily domain-containing protein [Linnemannia elongata]